MVIRLLPAAAAAALLASACAGSLGAEPPPAERLTIGESARQLVQQRPKAWLRAYRTTQDQAVRVDLSTNARRVKVRYLDRQHRPHLRSRRIRHGEARLTLPSGTSGIEARTKRTRSLASSGWTKAKPRTRVPRSQNSKGITDAQLRTAARLRVFFGHQSVGRDILSGIPAVYESRDLDAPLIASGRPPIAGRGSITEVEIGSNGNPIGKIQDFAERIRRGVGADVDVALMKLCYVDVTEGTDVKGLFASYRATMTALAREHPNVTFLYVTVPLTTGSTADNVVREQFNSFVRGHSGGKLFDLASIESTTPSGNRVSGISRGHPFYSLYSGYARDSGHLNDAGARAAAVGFLRAIADRSS